MLPILFQSQQAIAEVFRLLNPATNGQATGAPDQLVDMTFTFNGSQCAIDARAQSLSPLNTWTLDVATAGGVNLWEVTNGSYTSRVALGNGTITNGVWRVQWLMQGTAHKAWFNGALLINYIDVNNKYLTERIFRVYAASTAGIASVVSYRKYPGFL